jgi:RNAse (barnase) inhibitor barstar
VNITIPPIITNRFAAFENDFMASLLELLRDSSRAGVYRSAIDSAEIGAAAAASGLRTTRIDLRRTRRKAELMTAFARAFEFPAHFGGNWDALSDSLADLSWLPGKGWLLMLVNGKPFAERCSSDWDTLLEILQAAADAWREQQIGFWVIVQDQAGWEPDLPQISRASPP